RVPELLGVEEDAVEVEHDRLEHEPQSRGRRRAMMFGMPGPQRRAGRFVEPAEDPRGAGLPAGDDERATLAGYLRFQRETLKLKCDGLTPEQLARRSVEPSSLSLLGLVRHMADVERHWFRRVMAGEDVERRFRLPDHADADFDGALPDAAVVAEAWAAWGEEVAWAERFLDEHADLGMRAAIPGHGDVSLREVLIHMVEEYARHNGHADLLRERIDGRIGQ
ncbi:MAG: DinB family protein, partial [Acidimicrobiales bacterium]